MRQKSPTKYKNTVLYVSFNNVTYLYFSNLCTFPRVVVDATFSILFSNLRITMSKLIRDKENGLFSKNS